MGLLRVLTLTFAALAASIPSGAQAGGHVGMGRGQSVREPSNSISVFPMSPRMPRRFGRTPLGGAGIISWGSYESAPYVVAPEGPAEVPVPVVVQIPRPPEPPVADPKFVFPPAPRAPDPPGTQTVIVQRGSEIEVLSFPATR